jgi:hypothetical protein
MPIHMRLQAMQEIRGTLRMRRGGEDRQVREGDHPPQRGRAGSVLKVQQ